MIIFFCQPTMKIVENGRENEVIRATYDNAERAESINWNSTFSAYFFLLEIHVISFFLFFCEFRKLMISVDGVIGAVADLLCLFSVKTQCRMEWPIQYL